MIKGVTDVLGYLSGSSFYQKLIRWFLISLLVFIAFFIIMIIDGFSGVTSLIKSSLPNGTIMGPGKNGRLCIGNLSNGILTFNYDIGFYANNRYGKTVSNDIYEDSGQSTEWVYTGYVTNGQKLSIAADGVYFPYGSDITPMNFSTKYVLNQFEGKTIEVMKFEDKYVQCDLNTDLTQDEIIKVDNIGLNSQHLSRYTYDGNVTNQNKNIVDYDSIGQSDCIKNLNCRPKSQPYEREYKPCALMDGAGIYVAFGEDPSFAYHLYNMQVPTITAKCTDNNYSGIAQFANNGVSQPVSCEYSYVLDSNRQIVWTRIPMSLPISTFNPVIDYNAIKDLKNFTDQVSLVNVSQSVINTQYKYSTYALADLSNCSGSASDYVLIGNLCYKLNKDVLIEDAKKQGCPFVNSGFGLNPTVYPNELCPPPYAQRIYVKAFNTNYDVSNGLVSLTFLSGAKLEESIAKKNGSLNFLSEVINTILSPLLGAQVEESIKDNTIVRHETKSGSDNSVDGKIIVEIKQSYQNTSKAGVNDSELIASSRDGNIVIQFSKYSSQGILISIPAFPNKAAKFLNFSHSGGDKSKIKIEINREGNYVGINSLSNVKIEYVSNVNHDFIKIDNIRNGYFVQIRNLILNSYFLQLTRFLLIIWYIAFFGFGIIRGEKTFSRDQIRDDFFRFSMLIWLTNPGSYEFMDDFVIPICFRGFLNLATIFQAAGASMMGMSMDLYNPLDFFDNIVSIGFSKEFWSKIYAICFSGYFWLHFLLFPLLCSGFIRMVMCFLKYIISMIFATVNFGVILMLFPIICTMSMFSQYESLLKTTLGKIKDEFVNLAVSIGLFGMMSGFIVSYFLKAISYRICWESLFDITIIPLILEFRFYTWQVKDVEVSVVLLNAGVFYLMSKTFDILPSIATQFATQLFGGSGGLGMNMAAGGQMFDKLASLGSGAFSYVGSKINFSGAYKTAEQKQMMNKLKQYNDLLGKKVLNNNNLRVGRSGIMSDSDQKKLDKLAKDLNSYIRSNSNNQFGQMLRDSVKSSNDRFQNAYQNNMDERDKNKKAFDNIAKSKEVLDAIKGVRNERKEQSQGENNIPNANQRGEFNNNPNQTKPNNTLRSNINNTSSANEDDKSGGLKIMDKNGVATNIDKNVVRSLKEDMRNMNDKQKEEYFKNKVNDWSNQSKENSDKKLDKDFENVINKNEETIRNVQEAFKKSSFSDDNKPSGKDNNSIADQKEAFEQMQKNVAEQENTIHEIKKYQEQKKNFQNEEGVQDVYSGLKNDGDKNDGW